MIERGEQGDNWFFNGGVTTLNSYRVTAGGNDGDTYGDTDALRRRLIDSMPPRHLAFLRRLGLRHSEGDYLFVHASFRPGIPLSHQRPDDLIWIRAPFLNADDDFGQVVVHGHMPDFDPVVRANRIGIDTLAYRSGCLTCLVPEGEERRFLQT
ncbi:MAG: hypothetical protein VW405_04630 [Rhodospirillaceae bacterium]